MTPQEITKRCQQEIAAREAHLRCLQLEIQALKSIMEAIAKDTNLVNGTEVLFTFSAKSPAEPDGRCPWPSRERNG